MEKWGTLEEVAAITKIAVKSLRDRKADTQDLPRIRAGRRVLISERHLQAWMKKRENQAEARARVHLKAER